MKKFLCLIFLALLCFSVNSNASPIQKDFSIMDSGSSAVIADMQTSSINQNVFVVEQSPIFVLQSVSCCEENRQFISYTNKDEVGLKYNYYSKSFLANNPKFCYS